jgi:hypothetical protein
MLKQYDSLTDLLSMFAMMRRWFYGEERRVVWLRENNSRSIQVEAQELPDLR